MNVISADPDQQTEALPQHSRGLQQRLPAAVRGVHRSSVAALRGRGSLHGAVGQIQPQHHHLHRWLYCITHTDEITSACKNLCNISFFNHQSLTFLTWMLWLPTSLWLWSVFTAPSTRGSTSTKCPNCSRRSRYVLSFGKMLHARWLVTGERGRISQISW